MGTGRKDEIHKDAVRIALTSGLSRRYNDNVVGCLLATFKNCVATQFACSQKSACRVLIKLSIDFLVM
jgi:hypothetical protein